MQCKQSTYSTSRINNPGTGPRGLTLINVEGQVWTCIKTSMIPQLSFVPERRLILSKFLACCLTAEHCDYISADKFVYFDSMGNKA
jgi:hypothetical protein